jgi:hypothetical protein
MAILVTAGLKAENSGKLHKGNPGGAEKALNAGVY